jgi:hypothetical protein
VITLPLADPSADLATTGGKGSSLATLVRAGLPVPPGFHVTTAAYRAYVALHHLQEKILATDERGVAELFAAHPVPEEIAGPIREAYARLGSPAVAVRSSATAEDLPEASFAGQQDTILDVRGADAVLDAVRHCWASLWTDRAVAYREREGIDPSDVALAVVVQELVDAESAGVLFTADPVSAAPDRMVVNATWGLGEALVSGAVTPDELVLDAATGTVRERRTGDKATMTVRGDGATHEVPVPAQLRTAQVLDDAAAAELAALGRRIATHYGRPMDVEWARAHGAFAIVQARRRPPVDEHQPRRGRPRRDDAVHVVAGADLHGARDGDRDAAERARLRDRRRPLLPRSQPHGVAGGAVRGVGEAVPLAHRVDLRPVARRPRDPARAPAPRTDAARTAAPRVAGQVRAAPTPSSSAGCGRASCGRCSSRSPTCWRRPDAATRSPCSPCRSGW